MPNGSDRWVTEAEAAARLGVSGDTVRRRGRAGQIPTRPEGRGIRYRVDAPPLPSSTEEQLANTLEALHREQDHVRVLTALLIRCAKTYFGEELPTVDLSSDERKTQDSLLGMLRGTPTSKKRTTSLRPVSSSTSRRAGVHANSTPAGAR